VTSTLTLVCFDFGKKRIGVAVGQTLTGTATPLATVPVKNNIPDWDRITRIMTEWKPGALVVGHPLNMDGSGQAMTRAANRFAAQLSERFACPVYRADERLSSYEARQRLQSTWDLDAVAAQVILETWLSENPAISQKNATIAGANTPSGQTMGFGEQEIEQLLDKMATDLQAMLAETGRTDPLLIGIHTGGYWIATKLRQKLRPELPLGELNIAFYRDDFSRIGMHPHVTPSKLPFAVEDRHIILVDDVLHTGRTIRAAMNEIFDYGRPASISLAVLFERSGHELPIKADIAGTTIALQADEHAKLLGPEPLILEIKKAE
jgi:pyrimidine operon attenuation protein / uracil phosphoribosyltransferase